MKYGIYRLPCGEVSATLAEFLNRNFKQVLPVPLPEKCSGCSHMIRESKGMKGYFCPGKPEGTVYLGAGEIKAMAVRKWQGLEDAKSLERNAREDREG